MQIYTLNVGQGQFVAVTSGTEALIVDTHVPLAPKVPVVNVKAALADILAGKNLVGLLITGFDSDHFNEVGLRIILNKYRPNWLMFPKYFKNTATADTCFSVIRTFESQKSILRVSVALDSNPSRFYESLSDRFSFELFSPHSEDMNSSNNCSLVCKVREKATGATYLITGDTESDRWASIVRIFGRSIAADVLAAPHHGSHNGISMAALRLVEPQTVLISAGVANAYGHPDAEAVALYAGIAEHVYSTNHGQGQSIVTTTSPLGVSSAIYNP